MKSIREPQGLQWTHSRRCLEVLLQAETSTTKNKGQALTSEELKSHEQRLTERLERLNLDMCSVSGDGNCQFRSISLELYGSQDHHQAIRRKAVAHMREQRDEFECFLGEDFDEYCLQMARGGTWGDELTLRAVCDSYGLIIHVVTSDMDNWYLKYEPEQLKTPREIFITYIAPIHYNSIRRQSSLKTMALGLGRSFRRLGSMTPTTPTGGSISGASGVASPTAAQQQRTVDYGDLRVEA